MTGLETIMLFAFGVGGGAGSLIFAEGMTEGWLEPMLIEKFPKLKPIIDKMDEWDAKDAGKEDIDIVIYNYVVRVTKDLSNTIIDFLDARIDEMIANKTIKKAERKEKRHQLIEKIKTIKHIKEIDMTVDIDELKESIAEKMGVLKALWKEILYAFRLTTKETEEEIETLTEGMVEVIEQVEDEVDKEAEYLRAKRDETFNLLAGFEIFDNLTVEKE